MKDYLVKIKTQNLMPGGDGDPHTYIVPVTGTIKSPTDTKPKKVGKFNALIINREAAALDDYISTLSLLDDYDADLATLIPLFRRTPTEETADLSKPLYKALGYGDSLDLSYSGNFVYLRRFELLPEMRGKNEGAEILHKLLFYFESLYNFDFFVLKPFPLQFETSVPEDKWRGKMKLDSFRTGESVSRKKLRTIYKNAGFNRVGVSEFMVRLNFGCEE